MKKSLFNRVNAIILAVCLVISCFLTSKIEKIYASEDSNVIFDEQNEGDWDQGGDSQSDGDPYDGGNESKNEGGGESQPDPFDYNLTCYTPNMNFGTRYEGDYIDPLQFSIVNIGSNSFPLTWDEFDSSTAFFIMPMCGADMNLSPGSQIGFEVYTTNDLAPGDYSANYVFYSANDIRQHHRVQVTVTVSIRAQDPYITDVTVYPDRVTVAAGKSYQFQAEVSGGNGYNPNVYWSVAGNTSSSTTISSSGVLTIGNDEDSSSVAAIATSVQDPYYYDGAVVNVQSVDHMVSVQASPSDGGAIAGGGAVRNGGSVRVSASPNNNYSFAGWYEGSNLISTAAQFDVTNVTSDRNLVAKFNRATCYIRTRVNTSDGGTVTDSSNVGYGGSYTITAKANTGYVFNKFVENNKTLSESSSIQLSNITSDRDITAVFERAKRTIYANVTPSDSGKVDYAGTFDRGQRVVLKETPYNGYEFAGWIINGQIVSYDETYEIKSLDYDVNITASFRKKAAKTYKIVSGIANEGGAIVPSGDYIVTEGGSVTYNMVPDTGYRVLAVAVDGKNIGALGSYTFNNVTGAHSIAVSFEKIPLQPAKQSASTTGQTSAVKKQPTAPKTEYNDDTAQEGAIPEQIIFFDTPSDEVTELEGSEYAEDTYVPAQETPVVATDSNQTISPNSIIARHGLDEETVRRLINDSSEMALLKEAYETGIIRVSVNNSYALVQQETAQGLYFDNPSIMNFEEVVSKTLSADEKLSAFEGTPILFNVSISDNTDTVDAATKSLMQKMVGYKPLRYFDFFVMKTMSGNSEVLTRTGAEMLVVLPVPTEYLGKNWNFCILRNHNGDVDILTDLDDEPTTITFRTDKFSEYSIAYEAVNINKLILRIVIVILLALVLAAICYTNLWIYRHRARKARK
ncbi:MAG: InlB B-repeat-containing protein [Butyrivibrio sp.]|nr:InlB B-repeat-containing protein [Butyrivibrio sp.]